MHVCVHLWESQRFTYHWLGVVGAVPPSSVCVCQCPRVTSVPAQQTVYMIIKRPLCLQTSLLCVCACVWLCVCYFGQKHHFKRLLPWRYLKVKRLGFSFCSVFFLFCVCVCVRMHILTSLCACSLHRGFGKQGFQCQGRTIKYTRTHYLWPIYWIWIENFVTPSSLLFNVTFFLFLPVSSYKLPFFHLPFSPGFSFSFPRVRENPKLLFVKETCTEESNSSFSLKQQQQKNPQKKIGTW